MPGHHDLYLSQNVRIIASLHGCLCALTFPSHSAQLINNPANAPGWGIQANRNTLTPSCRFAMNLPLAIGARTRVEGVIWD